MKFYQLIILVLCIVFINLPSAALSQEFSWTNAFNQTANQDIDAFKKRLADRFNKKQNQINEILKQGRTASDTYMAFKLSEMSGQSVSNVANTYDKNKSKGWGVLAKELGIKPGSKEFHALKKKDDLYHGKYSETVERKKKKYKKNGNKKANKNKKNKLDNLKKEKKKDHEEKEMENRSEKEKDAKENKKKWWNFFD